MKKTQTNSELSEEGRVDLALTIADALSFGEISGFLRSAEHAVRQRNETAAVFLIKKAVGTTSCIANPWLKKFALDLFYEQTKRDDPAFYPLAINYLLRTGSVTEARLSLAMIAHRFIEGCAVTPFELIIEKNFDALSEYVDNCRVTYGGRISSANLEAAWEIYCGRKSLPQLRIDECMSRLGRLSAKNAQDFLVEAKSFAKQGKWGRGYTFLTLAMEEGAKSQLCHLRNSWLVEIQASKTAGRKPLGLEIDEGLVVDMFKSHETKRRVVATQVLLWLVNTHDLRKRKRVLAAIMNNKPELDEEVTEVAALLRCLPEKREEGFYVDNEANCPDAFSEEDYSRLESIIERYLKNLNAHTSLKATPYRDLLKSVSILLGWTKSQPK